MSAHEGNEKDVHHRRLTDTEVTAMNELIGVVEALRQEVAGCAAICQKLNAGFAGGDTEGHRRYHEEVIQRMADARAIRKELISHLVKASVWAMIIGVLAMSWSYLKVKLGLAP